MSWHSVAFVCVLLFIAVYIVDCGTIRLQRPTEPQQFNKATPKKRPFCNAFTGCGRKRSTLNVSPVNQNDNEDQQNNIDDDFFEDSLGDLLDLNSEPAVEDLMRQIMSQAKLWEAIQEANREITIMKNDRNGVSRKQFPAVAFNAQ